MVLLPTFSTSLTNVRYLHDMRDAWGGLIPCDVYSVTAGRVQRAIHGAAAAKGRHMAQKDF